MEGNGLSKYSALEVWEGETDRRRGKVGSTRGNGSFPGESSRSADVLHIDGGEHAPQVDRLSIGGLLVLKSLLYFIYKSCTLKMMGFQGESGSLNLFLGININ